ncbi:MAG: hypothetical protein GXZ04_05645 [Clostridiales bacterium]|nr:hypothetical protein [Clostridiales bacterium]
MLRKCMVFCLTLMVLLSGIGNAAAEDVLYANFLEDDFGEDYPMSMASFKGQLYVLGGSGIYLLGPKAVTVKRLTEPEAASTDPSTSFLGMEHLFADEEGLLVFEGGTKILHRVLLDQDPVAKEEFFTVPDAEDIYFSQVAFRAPYLYTFEYGTRKLSRFHTGTGEVNSLIAQDVRDIAPYKNGQLLAVELSQTETGRSMAYVQYQFETGERSVLGEMDGSSVGSTVAYDYEKDLIYSASASQLFSWLVGEDKATPLSYLPRGDTYGLTLIDAGHAAIFSDGMVAVRPLTSGALQGRDTLKVLDPIGRAGNYTPFLKEHAQTELVFLDSGTLTQEERFINDMLTQSDEVDIYLLRDQNLISQIKKKGYAADMSGAPAVREVVDAYEKPFHDTAAQDGKILLFYKDAFVDVPVYSVSLFKELGYEPPKTFLEYYQLCERYIKEKMDDNPEIRIEPFGNTLDLPTVLTQIAAEMMKNGQELDFETAQMKELLAQIAKVANMKVTIGKDATQWLFYDYFLPFTPKDREYMLLTFLQGNAPALMPHGDAFTYFVINPFSKNQKTALQFMDSFARTLDASTTILRDTRATSGIESEEYASMAAAQTDQLKGFEEELAKLTGAEKSAMEQTIKDHKAMMESQQIDRWLFTPEQAALARRLAVEVSIPDFNPVRLLVKEYPDFFDEYLTNSNFDPDQFLSQLNQMVKTALIEQE